MISLPQDCAAYKNAADTGNSSIRRRSLPGTGNAQVVACSSCRATTDSSGCCSTTKVSKMLRDAAASLVPVAICALHLDVRQYARAAL
jgi:hypothetical protein